MSIWLQILIGVLVVVGLLLSPFLFALFMKFCLWFNYWKRNPVTWYLNRVTAALEWITREIG